MATEEKPLSELRVYTVQEASELLCVHPNTVRLKIKSGALIATKFGRNWLIPESELRKILDPESTHGNSTAANKQKE